MLKNPQNNFKIPVAGNGPFSIKMEFIFDDPKNINTHRSTYDYGLRSFHFIDLSEKNEYAMGIQAYNNFQNLLY